MTRNKLFRPTQELRGLITAIALAAWALANTVVADEVQVNYSAYPSTFLSAEMAALFKITRADNLAVVNINVVQGEQNLTATVSGTATNMLQQIKPLVFREVRDAGAIYYIAEQRYDDAERLTFKVTVLATGAKQAQQLQWQKQFYRD